MGFTIIGVVFVVLTILEYTPSYTFILSFVLMALGTWQEHQFYLDIKRIADYLEFWGEE